MMNGGKIMDKPLVTIEYKINSTKTISIEVSTSVKEVIEQTDRTIRSQRRQDRRRIDFTPLTDEFLELSVRAASEDTAVLYEQIERNERLYAAIDKLTEVQKRRVSLYYFRGLNQREIAEMEGVGKASIGHSLALALKQLNRILAEQ